jgi:hypothetical protein
MKLKVKADIELEVQLPDVLAFLQEDKLTPEQLDTVVVEAMRRKKGFYTVEDQMKYELFDQYKDKYTAMEFEKRLQ